MFGRVLNYVKINIQRKMFEYISMKRYRTLKLISLHQIIFVGLCHCTGRCHLLRETKGCRLMYQILPVNMLLYMQILRNILKIFFQSTVKKVNIPVFHKYLNIRIKMLNAHTKSQCHFSDGFEFSPLLKTKCFYIYMYIFFVA